MELLKVVRWIVPQKVYEGLATDPVNGPESILQLVQFSFFSEF